MELLAKSRGDVNRHKARTRTTSAQVRINDVVLGQVSEEIKDEEDEYTPLHFATASQSIPAMSALLACRADPTRAAKAYPPLHMAAAAGTETLIDALVQGKANLEQKGKFGETAIFSAASKNKASTLQQLLDYRASPDVSSNGASTCSASARYLPIQFVGSVEVWGTPCLAPACTTWEHQLYTGLQCRVKT